MKHGHLSKLIGAENRIQRQGHTQGFESPGRTMPALPNRLGNREDSSGHTVRQSGDSLTCGGSFRLWGELEFTPVFLCTRVDTGLDT